MLRTSRDRAALGISLGGNGSRRDTLGILVVGITDDGPAGKAGVEEGDRVAAINGVDLRVAPEDAGDAQASSARINRLNREMEKVKAGDAVELRVYSAGQTRTVRVDAMKASDLQGEGFFFNNGAGVRMLTIPRAVRVRPPGVEFDDLTTRARTKAELENHLRSLQETLRESVEPTARLSTDHCEVGRATSVWGRLSRPSAASTTTSASACAPSSSDGTRWQGAATVGSHGKRSIATTVCCVWNACPDLPRCGPCGEASRSAGYRKSVSPVR
jgi:hypothetical protein